MDEMRLPASATPMIMIEIVMYEHADGDEFNMRVNSVDRERPISVPEALGLLELAKAKYLDDIAQQQTRTAR